MWPDTTGVQGRSIRSNNFEYLRGLPVKSERVLRARILSAWKLKVNDRLIDRRSLHMPTLGVCPLLIMQACLRRAINSPKTRVTLYCKTHLQVYDHLKSTAP